jgi:FAD/FMN-containing dehydrogenase
MKEELPKIDGVTRCAYVNYGAGTDQHAAGADAKLKEIKAHYDPDGILRSI